MNSIFKTTEDWFIPFTLVEKVGFDLISLLSEVYQTKLPGPEPRIILHFAIVTLKRSVHSIAYIFFYFHTFHRLPCGLDLPCSNVFHDHIPLNQNLH